MEVKKKRSLYFEISSSVYSELKTFETTLLLCYDASVYQDPTQKPRSKCLMGFFFKKSAR